MKSVITSIQPYYVFLIIARLMGWNVSQHKTVEVRKDFPKDPAWNKRVHIYCSKNRKSFNRIPKEYQPFMEKLLGKVVGEFVCDEVITPIMAYCSFANQITPCELPYICITDKELIDYLGNGKEGYGWHISDLKIYDKPKELIEFKTTKKCKHAPLFGICSESCGIAENGECDGRKYINRITNPPQSWQYCEA